MNQLIEQSNHNEQKKRLMLVDGHSLAYRSFYAFPETLTLPDGRPINAVYGFIALLYRSLDEFTPDYLCVCFDRKEPTHRHNMFPEYKAHRSPPPDTFKIQMPMLYTILDELKISQTSMAGFEADDLLGTYGTIAAAQGHDAYIMTGDTDALQLVTDSIKVVMSRKGKDPFHVFNPSEVEKKYSLTPDQLIDLKALKGDSSDNIPGVKGIGDKTATQLLTDYKTLENVYNHLEDIQKKAVKTKLEEGKDIAFLSYDLVKIVKDAPVDANLEPFSYKPDWENVANIFKNYHFQSLYKKYSARVKGGHTQTELAETGNAHNPGEKNTGSSIIGPNATGTATTGPNATGTSTTRRTATTGPNAAGTANARLQPTQPEPLTPDANGTQLQSTIQTTYTLVTSTKDLKEKIKTLGSTFAFDLETTSKSPIDAQIVGISFSNEAGAAFYVPMNKFINEDALSDVQNTSLFGNLNNTSTDIFKMNPLLELIKPVLEDASIKKITHHGKYEFNVLRNYNIKLAGVDFDTMLAAFLLFPLQKIGLKALAFQHFGVEMTEFTDLTGKGKQSIRFDQVPIEQALDYACADADLTWRLFELFQPMLIKEDVASIFETIECPVQKVLADMEYDGVSLDANFLIRYQKELAQKNQDLTTTIHELAGEPFNIKSTKQLGYILFEKLELPVIKKTKTGFSTDASVLEKLQNKHEIAKHLLSFRTNEKLLNTYVTVLPTLVNDRTKKIHTSFNQAIAQTGRLSSTHPNLQNIPIRTPEGLEVRKAFIPSKPDWSIISSDYSQIELRIMAHLAEDEHLIQAFLDGQDIHASTASVVFKTPLADVTKEQRYKAKAVNFGILYGISAFGLSENLSISRKEAKEIIDTYFETFPSIKTFIKTSIVEAREQGCVVTEFGRKRPITDIDSSNPAQRKFAERMAVNTKVQGTAADIIKIAMVHMQNALKASKLKTKMIIQVHDELVFDAPDSELDEVKTLITSTMEKATKLKVPLKVDIARGKNWKEVS